MLEKGEIIYRNNLVFEDTGKLDLKINGHPTLNITDGENGFVYFFLITSSRINRDDKNSCYYKLEAEKFGGIKKRSWVDLAYVFKEECVNRMPAGAVSEDVYNDIILQFIKNFHNSNIAYSDKQLKVIREAISEINYSKCAKSLFLNKKEKIEKERGLGGNP